MVCVDDDLSSHFLYQPLPSWPGRGGLAKPRDTAMAFWLPAFHAFAVGPSESRSGFTAECPQRQVTLTLSAVAPTPGTPPGRRHETRDWVIPEAAWGPDAPERPCAQPPPGLGVPAHTDSTQVVWTAVRMGSGTPSLGPEPPGGLPRSQGFSTGGWRREVSGFYDGSLWRYLVDVANTNFPFDAPNVNLQSFAARNSTHLSDDLSSRLDFSIFSNNNIKHY